MVGRVFGCWSVTEEGPRRGKRRHRHWKCKCICGSENLVSQDNLVSGGSTKCRRCSRVKNGAAFTRVWMKYQWVAAKNRRTFTLTQDQFRELTQAVCHYCGQPPNNRNVAGSGEEFVYNGIDRKDNVVGGNYPLTTSRTYGILFP